MRHTEDHVDRVEISKARQNTAEPSTNTMSFRHLTQHLTWTKYLVMAIVILISIITAMKWTERITFALLCDSSILRRIFRASSWCDHQMAINLNYAQLASHHGLFRTAVAHVSQVASKDVTAMFSEKNNLIHLSHHLLARNTQGAADISNRLSDYGNVLTELVPAVLAVNLRAPMFVEASLRLLSHIANSMEYAKDHQINSVEALHSVASLRYFRDFLGEFSRKVDHALVLCVRADHVIGDVHLKLAELNYIVADQWSFWDLFMNSYSDYSLVRRLVLQTEQARESLSQVQADVMKLTSQMDGIWNVIEFQQIMNEDSKQVDGLKETLAWMHQQRHSLVISEKV